MSCRLPNIITSTVLQLDGVVLTHDNGYDMQIYELGPQYAAIFNSALKVGDPNGMLKAILDASNFNNWNEQYWLNTRADGKSVAWIAATSGDFKCYEAMLNFACQARPPGEDDLMFEGRCFSFHLEILEYANNRYLKYPAVSELSIAAIGDELIALIEIYLKQDAHSAQERGIKLMGALSKSCEEAIEKSKNISISIELAEKEKVLLHCATATLNATKRAVRSL